MSLQAKLDAMKAHFEANIATPEMIATMHRTTADLIDSGLADRARKLGEQAPDFALADPDGNQVALAALLADGPVAISFYRGVWCPFCNAEMQALEAAADDIRARGATLVAISSQTAIQSRKSQRDNNLSFPILSDPGNRVAHAYGLRFGLPEELIALYRSFGLDLPRSNGDDSWTLPMPARFVIAPDGVIAYAEVNPDYTRRPDPSELLPVLEALQPVGA